jgi:hypothetical protein
MMILEWAGVPISPQPALRRKGGRDTIAAMPEPAMSLLSGWETFYVIIGSSAAALTGLMFVVIALTGEGKEAPASLASLRAWATPTVVHFGAVLLLAAVLTTPGHTVATLSVCLGSCGVAGLWFTRWVVRQARRQTEYVPKPEDWRWHVTLPIIAYASLLVASAGLSWRPLLALVLVGAAALFLLYIGIHNSWDAAIWVSVGRRAAEQEGPGSSKR